MDPQKVTVILNGIEFYDGDYTAKADKVDELKDEVVRVSKRQKINELPRRKQRGILKQR